MTMSLQETKKPQKYKWQVPDELGIPCDTLRLRLDFFHQSCTMTVYEGEIVEAKPVDALDIAHALASELSFGTGILPENTLWWQNTRGGPVTAIYDPPKIRTLTLQTSAKKKPQRFTVPLPGFIFLCMPGQPPWVYAVRSRPTKDTDIVYRAPLANIFANGRSCPGTQKYPERVADVIETFFISFFSETADLGERSVKFPKNIIGLWRFLDHMKTFPIDDLVSHGTMLDLMTMLVSQ